MLVLDASFVLSSILPDEAGGDPAGLFDSYDEVIAPWLLWAEVRNSLLTLERRGRLSATFVDSTIRRPAWEEKTRCCSAAESRENRGSTSTWPPRPLREPRSRPRAWA